jgi:salicylate hydroxylase
MTLTAAAAAFSLQAMTRPAKKIAVIGGGLGGLAAALSLNRAGLVVDVYEQAPELNEVGGGINMGPNAARILYRLGLGAALDREAVRPLSAHVRRWDDGRTLQKAPLNPLCDELYGAPHLTAHRADLQRIIASALPQERIHLGHRLVGIADRGDAVEATFDNGAQIDADVLIGTDGIHSTARAILFGADDPLFAGCVAYRGLVPAERIADLALERGNQSWLGPGGHLVHYFVSGGQLLNFVGWTEHALWNREDWTDRAAIEPALAAFAGWHPQVRRIISAADTCFIWALFDRDPLPRWSKGRMTLLGDACHPMYPFMAQGAAQAIEDGATLAALLARGGDPVESLRRYEDIRLPRVTRLQEMSRANKQRYHLPDGPEQQARDAAMVANRERAPETMRWLFGFDAASVDAA